MKPSERIEIEFQKLLNENPRRIERIENGEEILAIRIELMAIKNYLDEQYLSDTNGRKTKK